ncbi:Chromatin structure-remodeling complex protein rsc9 [Ascochyta rabiei]|uniref:Chromatin structure-remodeling complex protein rsc9 n=1 Tax=Didymella rabiei TaxID=5454 RepID=UPI0018FF93A3|nr:Chromatin structure-remodeling complex protein rsc9 [Ascochyta rabiei]UPX15420.1 Chromatin structure-remodeling complex protein rsc9 [Ascochyta rabiei]
MAPSKPREPSIERTEEYDKFIEELEAYHEKRGTFLDREPKVANQHIDLLRLYKRVNEEGGYDKVSDTKNNKLAWRRLATDFLRDSSASQLTTQAFLVKTAYYKNLAAYEISTIHKREPPPKEILEDITAKGGDLLNRTVENFYRGSRETERLRNGDSDDSDEDGDVKKTPKDDKMDVDEPGSTGRATRSLRHAPPQRVLFQPESSIRQTRQSAGHLNSPQPNGYGTSAAAVAIANYEPRTNIPLALKQVVTPSNNLDAYVASRKKYIVNRKNRPVPLKGMMLPGTGFPGPNIYIRALHALRSKEPEEEAYALHHLVKISHERGDKYRFDQFPGLAEALIAKVIDVGSLFFDVQWDISYVEEEFDQADVLNGLSGTKDLLKKIRALQTLDIDDDLLPEENAKALNMINEAALIIRNMVMLKENALFASMIPAVRDLIVILLNLPKHPTVVELQHYALEIAEQLTKYWILDSQDPVYQSLLAQIDTDDRGRIITSLRALGRISMNLEATNKLSDVPVKTLQSICDWLLVEDEDLRIACLDFLYLFTGFPDNVELLAHEVNIEGVVGQLVRLLQFGAIAYEERRNTPKPTKSSTPNDAAPKLSSAIIDHLVTLEEPERSSQWLKTCFEEDPTGEITQIQLWSAYNAAFQEAMTANPSAFKALMPAKDFITNVSTTFGGASAQVLTVGGQPKYTIRGIRPRSVPVDPSTKKQYIRCCWIAPNIVNGQPEQEYSAKTECGEFASGARAMWEHVVGAHLKVPRDQETGQWLLEPKPDIDMENGDAITTSNPQNYNCYWANCSHFTSDTDSAFLAGQHIKTHLPDTSIKQAIHARHNRAAEDARPSTSSAQASIAGYNSNPGSNDNYTSTDKSSSLTPNFRYFNTATDEANDAAGLPLSSVLVLRNLARQLNKIPPPSEVLEIPDAPTHKRTFSATEPQSPSTHRTTGAKKPRLGDAAREQAREDGEREEQEAKSVGWVPRVFAPVREQLAFVASHNLTLKNYMGGLLKAVADGGA